MKQTMCMVNPGTLQTQAGNSLSKLKSGPPAAVSNRQNCPTLSQNCTRCLIPDRCGRRASPPSSSVQDGPLLYRQSNGNLLDGPVDVFQRLAAQSRPSLLQQTLSCAELCIRNALRFMALSVAADIHAQGFSGRFDLPHSGDAVAFVIVIGLRERGISLAQQAGGRNRTGGRNRISQEIQTEKQHPARNRHADQRAKKRCFHIVF